MTKREYKFEYRLRRILESKNYLVIKAGASRPFDIVAVKGQVAFPIEVKARNTRYPKSQEAEQVRLCRATGNCFYLIRQGARRGKFTVEIKAMPDRDGVPDEALLVLEGFREEFEEYLE